MTYPFSRVITYNYSNDRAVSVLNNAANLATNINYKPFGGMSSITYGNGLTEAISYDNQYRVSGITAGTVMNLSYSQYDANGNILAISNVLDPTKNKSFGYDALDRLTSGTGSWGSLGWTYDGVGNRLTENSNSYTYFLNTNKLSSANGKSFGYDNNGNTTSEAARIYTYNQNQRLIQVVDGAMTANYNYNGNGQRVKKVVNGTTTVFHYSSSGQLIAESDGTGATTAEYVYLNGRPLAKIEGSNVYFYHDDNLGTPQKMTDSSGGVVWSADYKPFGEATITVSTITNNLRFPGQYYDAETGNHYNYARDYDPVIGRYKESDPIGIKRGGNHLYVYAHANPILFTDPNGLLSCVYVTDSHTMSCVNNQNQSMSTTAFFSGRQNCKDDPTCRNKKDKGPIPPGTYSIMPPGYSAKHPDWMYLDPNQVELGDRTGEFFIHPGSNSRGCIVVLKSNISDFNTISSWATQDNGGTLIVISTSDPTT